MGPSTVQGSADIDPIRESVGAGREDAATFARDHGGCEASEDAREIRRLSALRPEPGREERKCADEGFIESPSGQIDRRTDDEAER